MPTALLLITASFWQGADNPAPTTPRLGLDLRQSPTGLGQEVFSLNSASPLRDQLRVGDLLHAVQDSDGTRRSIQGPADVIAVRDRLVNGEAVRLKVLRPNTGDQSRYTELTIVLTRQSLVEQGVGGLRDRQWQRTIQSMEDPGAVRRPLSVEVVREDGVIEVNVLYSTDRALVGQKYTGARDLSNQPMKYGECVVTLPPDHRYGQLERPGLWWYRLKANPMKHIVLRSVSQYHGAADFSRRLAGRLAEARRPRRLLLFIHGYNVDFASAARRTAQLAYDLQFEGQAMFYSWPSDGEEQAYMSDAVDIQWATSHIKQLLGDLAQRSDVDEIVLVAHSMGNRGAAWALADLARDQPRETVNKIRDVILAAPDIDAAVFRKDLAPRLSNGYRRVTLYASANDKALLLSNRLHAFDRAGQIVGGQPTVSPLAQLELIDASNVDTDFLGHSYYGDAETVLSDLYPLIRHGHSAANRRLRAVPLGQQRYWKVP